MKQSAPILIIALCCTSLTPATASEISFPDHHLAVTLPDSLERSPDVTPGVLLLAESKKDGFRVMLTKPPFPAIVKLSDPNVQSNIKEALRAQGFSKIVRAGLIKVTGKEAYLCEATMTERPISIAQIVWLHEGSFYSLVFLSQAKPIKDIKIAQDIIDSLRVLPTP